MTTRTAGSTKDRSGPSSRRAKIVTRTPLAASPLQSSTLSRSGPPPWNASVTITRFNRSVSNRDDMGENRPSAGEHADSNHYARSSSTRGRAFCSVVNFGTVGTSASRSDLCNMLVSKFGHGPQARVLLGEASETDVRELAKQLSRLSEIRTNSKNVPKITSSDRAVWAFVSVRRSEYCRTLGVVTQVGNGG